VVGPGKLKETQERKKKIKKGKKINVNRGGGTDFATDGEGNCKNYSKLEIKGS